MANIKILRMHDLGREQARAKVEGIAKQLKTGLKADYAWQGSSLKFERSGASGTIDVSDDLVQIDIRLGLALSPLKAKFEEEIEKHLAAALDPGRSG